MASDGKVSDLPAYAPDLMTDVLKTNRLVLTPASVGDAEELFPHLSNPGISKDMAWTPHTSIAETRAFLESVQRSRESGTARHWTIRYESAAVGLFSLIDIRRQHRAITYDRAELAYWLAPAFQRRGIMSEAGREVIRFAFEDLGLETLVVAHHVGNAASEGLIKRLGFVYSHREDRAFSKGGVWIDCLHYRLPRSVWEQSRNATST